MFVTYVKTVGGRTCNRYFRDWRNAKRALLKEYEECLRYDWKGVVKDYFNASKGFYVFQIDGVTDSGEKFSLALVESYFEDNE